MRRSSPILVLALAAVLVLAAPRPAGAESWRWPVGGPVLRAFRLLPGAPYSGGQHRGITLAATPRAAVRAACGGRVTFAGRVGASGPTVAVACGRLSATYTRLGAVRVRSGRVVAPGERIGVVGASGRIQLGARVRARRAGYADPLALLREAPSTPVGPAPGPVRRLRPPPLIGEPPRLLPVREPARPPLGVAGLPLGLGLLATASVYGVGRGLARRASRVPTPGPVARPARRSP